MTPLPVISVCPIQRSFMLFLGVGIRFPNVGLTLLFGPDVEWELDVKSRVVMCLGLYCRFDVLMSLIWHTVKIHRRISV